MRNYYWLYLPAAVCFMIAILSAIWHEKRGTDNQLYRDYYEIEKRCAHALESRSINTVQNTIDEWQSAFTKAEPVLDDATRYLFNVDMADLRQHLADLEEEKWAEKAEKHLSVFSNCYEMIMNGDMETFRDVDHLFALKKRCVSAWQDYFAVDLEPYRTTIYPKRYLREYMVDLYDPCMESHEALEKKLSEKIQYMRPEYRRKIQLFDILLDYVANEQSVMRNKILNLSLDGFTTDEIKICYRSLIKQNKMVEIKLADHVFVSLSDKEQDKRQKSVVKSLEHENQSGGTDTIIEKKQLSHDMLIEYLTENNLKFVDKMDKKGGLYFFDKSTAEQLKEKGYDVRYAANGAKATDYQPAWYIK